MILTSCEHLHFIGIKTVLKIWKKLCNLICCLNFMVEGGVDLRSPSFSDRIGCSYKKLYVKASNVTSTNCSFLWIFSLLFWPVTPLQNFFALVSATHSAVSASLHLSGARNVSCKCLQELVCPFGKKVVFPDLVNQVGIQPNHL